MTLTARPAIALSSYAARSCPVKTQNDFNPTVVRPVVGEPAPTPAYDQREPFRAAVFGQLLDALGSRVVDLRSTPGDASAAMSAGREVILGGRLPYDAEGHRVGKPDLLVRGPDRLDGGPSYHPVVIKWHKILDRTKTADPAVKPPHVEYSPLSEPFWAASGEAPGWTLRSRFRSYDFLQLAHYHRMLQAAGFAAESARGAVISTDRLGPTPTLVWVTLEGPDAEWLTRYDAEHDLRLRVATTASRQTGDVGRDPRLLVRPIVTSECARCSWWSTCRPQLNADDLSLRIDKGALDRAEITALRGLQIETTTDLLRSDLDTLLPLYLPKVSHRTGAESRLRTAVRRARMLVEGSAFDRESNTVIEVPAAAVEVDFDIESSADGRVYLWGFLVRSDGGEAHYREFSRFAELDAAAETELAREAFHWLRSLVEAGPSVAVYHYSGYEVTRIRDLADREDDDRLSWAAAYAEEHFVDLLETVKAHYFGLHGLGLKLIAQHAGFRWRDEDPGGLNSQVWFDDAVHAASPESRAAARRRVLDYNEDDVRATAHLRTWLRSQN